MSILGYIFTLILGIVLFDICILIRYKLFGSTKNDTVKVIIVIDLMIIIFWISSYSKLVSP